MCGRFALRTDRPRIRRAVPHVVDWVDEDIFVPRYNIAPRSYAPVVRRARRNDPNDAYPSQSVLLHTMKWGLVPHWSKTEDKTLSTTNARSENLIEGGGMWASIKGKNRCVVICQGYYEWLTKGKEKLPHFVKHKDEQQLMLMAGLYDHAIINGQSLWTFSIVTTDACPSLGWLHDRQPVILSTQEALNAWLDASTQTWTPALTKLVQPYSDEAHPLQCYQVPKEVGKVGNESPSFIEPIKERKDGIQAMFQKQAQGAAKRKRADSPLPPTSQDKDEKKLKTESSYTPPPSPRKRPPKTPSPRKAPSYIPERGKITAFFRKA
ncbi:hypothetical protein AX15_007762 [Amanita polypyramis BW_CC]|nr:hypothetical protein AX15_007762 [Amanita polypyramis BW_CC]